ncbi:MAG: hypothetical protein JO112_09830, partial [Planctomycetes bacterium]|nr:hypothetical protein [Planctomycetota bacterium]
MERMARALILLGTLAGCSSTETKPGGLPLPKSNKSSGFFLASNADPKSSPAPSAEDQSSPESEDAIISRGSCPAPSGLRPDSSDWLAAVEDAEPRAGGNLPPSEARRLPEPDASDMDAPLPEPKQVVVLDNLTNPARAGSDLGEKKSALPSSSRESDKADPPPEPPDFSKPPQALENHLARLPDTLPAVTSTSSTPAPSSPKEGDTAAKDQGKAPPRSEAGAPETKAKGNAETAPAVPKVSPEAPLPPSKEPSLTHLPEPGKTSAEAPVHAGSQPEPTVALAAADHNALRASVEMIPMEVPASVPGSPGTTSESSRTGPVLTDPAGPAPLPRASLEMPADIGGAQGKPGLTNTFDPSQVNSREGGPPDSLDPVVHVVGSKRISLNYQIKDVGRSGIADVELWYTQDGRTWQKYSGPAQNTPPYVVAVEDEDLYGFTLVGRSGVGLGKQPPQAGDLPQVWVQVDVTRPVVRLLGVEAGTGPQAGNLAILWLATDKNLPANPISLSYAHQAEGPWTPIATKVPTTGRYIWQMPAGIPNRFLVRVEAVDRAGNVGMAQTPSPLLGDVSEPSIA